MLNVTDSTTVIHIVIGATVIFALGGLITILHGHFVLSVSCC